MWKFIVIWCLTSVVHVKCPERDIVVIDEFGRKTKPYEFIDKLCVERKKDCGYSREFYNSREAHEFYYNAKNDNGYPQITGVELDSVFVGK